MAGNKLPGNPSWPRIPEAALQLRALRNRHVSAVTVINPPTAIYFSFQTTCESPELCVRVDPWQPQINITLCFMNEKKETQGIHLKAEQSKAGNSNILVLCCLLLTSDSQAEGRDQDLSWKI